MRSIASSTSAIDSTRGLPVSSVTTPAISMTRSRIASAAARSSRQRSSTGVARHARCASAASATASSTSSRGAWRARLATASARLGSARSKISPLVRERPPTMWGSGSCASSRAAASARSKAASSSGVRVPLV